MLSWAVVDPAHADRKPRQKAPSKIVYLTFDDGPNSLNDPRLLRILRREQVPATFFVLGNLLAADRQRATELWLAGHALGNHTWAHPDLTFLSPFAIHHQFASTQRLMGPGAGACMRPPYGATNSTVIDIARGLGLKQILWTVDPQDYAHQNAAYLTSYVASRVHDKAIVLMHDGGGPRAATTSAVKQLIPILRSRGYEFRTVPACRVRLGGTVTDAAKPKSRPPKPTPTPTPVVPDEPVPTAAAPAGMAS
jgi:peptidoglycan/xylan/chitin deacetylase (PgdA/CDA1 family)